MMFSKFLSISSLAAAAFAFAPHGHHQKTYGCGEVDIVFTWVMQISIGMNNEL